MGFVVTNLTMLGFHSDSSRGRSVMGALTDMLRAAYHPSFGFATDIYDSFRGRSVVC